MAYEKQTWTTGETITQEKLNHMEDGIANAGGFECTETVAELFDETVTTSGSSPSPVANLTYSQHITEDVLEITFDGIKYNCPKQDTGDGFFVYGAPNPSDFSQFPFVFGSSTSGNMIYTQTAGEHTIKAEIIEYSVTTTPCFKNAVLSLQTGTPITIVPIVIDDVSCSSTMSLADIGEAVTRGDTIIPMCDDHDTRFTMTGVFAGATDKGGGEKSYEFVFFYPPNPQNGSGRDFSGLYIAFCSIGRPNEFNLKYISFSYS